MDYRLLVGLMCTAGAVGVLGLALYERMRAQGDTPAVGGLTPPPDVTPAIAGLLLNRGTYLRTAMGGGVLSLQLHGFIALGEPDGEGKVTIRRLREDAPPEPDQAALLNALFERGPALRVDTRDAAVRDTLYVAQLAQQAAAMEFYDTRLFERFPTPLWPILGLSVLGAVLAAIGALSPPAIGGFTRFVFVALALAGLYAGWTTRRTRLSEHKVAIGFAVLVASGLALLSAAPIDCAIGAICAIVAGAAPGRVPSLSREGRGARRQMAALRDYLGNRKLVQADIDAGPVAAQARFSALMPYAVTFGVLHQFGTLNASLRESFINADAIVTPPPFTPPADQPSWDGSGYSAVRPDRAVDGAFVLVGALGALFGD